MSSFFSFLDKIRSKPDHRRSQIMWFCVIISMAIIVSFWAVSLKKTVNSIETNHSDISERESSQSLGQAKEEVPSLLAEIKSIFSAFLRDLKTNNERSKEKQEKEEEIEDKTEESSIEKKEDYYHPAKLPIQF